MAKKQRPKQRRRPAAASPTNQPSDKDSLTGVIDAVAEIVHQGFGRLLDVGELRVALEGWKPHCSMNYEYVFVWRPNLADQQRALQVAQQCLDSGTDCKWVDLSFINDSQGREVFVLEMGDAVTGEDDDMDSTVERLEEIWHWKSQPLTILGPFTSSDEAEAWMAENGAFKEAD